MFNRNLYLLYRIKLIFINFQLMKTQFFYSYGKTCVDENVEPFSLNKL